MRFRDIIGQEMVKSHLCQSVVDGRVPHAQLLTGKEGVGKLQLAIAYAQYLNCEHRIEGDSCGECPTCMQFQRLQHPDLHFVFPIVKGDRGDTCDDYATLFTGLIQEKHYFSLEDWYGVLGMDAKQGMIYEKESGEILKKLSLKAFGNGYKVMIIWQPEKMNTVCANKLLKLLEEPPARTVFLLVSEHPDQLLSTILSRVQEIRVPDLQETELSQHFPPAIAHMASGSYLKAVQLMATQECATQYFNDFVSLMRHAWLVAHKKDYNALLELRKWSLSIADSSVGREKQKAFLQYAQQQIRENFIYNLHQPAMNYQTPIEENFSKKFAPFIHWGNVEGIMNELDKAEQQISQNGNAKIIFFDLCLQMIVLIKREVS